MIIDLPDTSTAIVIRRLYEIREAGGAVTLGRVLTLVVGVDDGWSTEESIEAANEASREHPCRVIVVTMSPPDAAPSRLDAQIRVGADAGASEVILLHLSGPLAEHSDSVVLPFLLPDTPVVTWWPGTGPDRPADAPLGRLAKRRITGPTLGDPRAVLRRRQIGYSAGDTDLAWSNVTQWRALLASAIEHPRFGPIDSAVVSGPVTDASTELVAGWLAATLRVPVTRRVGTERIELTAAGESVAIARLSDHLAVLSRPGEHDSRVALGRRAIWDCLAEEMRRLDPDEIYENALAGLSQVLYEEAPDGDSHDGPLETRDLTP
ncbi:glucose-6-phosphate dehydrogenase assembly protein OpcA [Tomitella biformata]|uniref:glucose-6-phosphate dehydrogenase assembly protein OpcA n=1 Tax=Tomitella biformata TaxID=630403 RepID=UPI000463AD4C|nr:glucose-6-phosphate dehydrogenase assembly protein OpcA [Tomitella biformata]